MSVAAVLGSVFTRAELGSRSLTPETISTPYGAVRPHRAKELAAEAWLLFRHELPYRLLPHQIPCAALVPGKNRPGNSQTEPEHRQQAPALAELTSPISALGVEGKPVPFRNRLRHL